MRGFFIAAALLALIAWDSLENGGSLLSGVNADVGRYIDDTLRQAGLN
jgi:hypothetical protein